MSTTLHPLAALGKYANQPACFSFGKYKDQEISHVVRADPVYIGWCVSQSIGCVLEELSDVDIEYATQEYDAMNEGQFEDYLDELYHDIMWND